MAKSKPKLADQFTEEPIWTTQMRSRLLDGRLVGVDNSVWVYREVPLGPVVDAADPESGLEVAAPIFEAFEGLAQMTNSAFNRRIAAKSNYREVHLLLVNVPQAYTPPRNHPIAPYLRRSFSRQPVDKRVLLMGVKLIPAVGGSEGGFKAMIESVVETLTVGGVPMSDYDKDFKRINQMMDAVGLLPASDEAIHLANGWWNSGRNPDTPTLVHEDHLHFFSTVDSMRMANKIGVDRCREWDAAGISDQTAVTMAVVENLDLQFMNPTDARATWVSDLLDADALAVSIRGFIEPPAMTRKELRAQKKRYIDDIQERVANNKMQKAEQDEMLGLLSDVENYYATSGATPTLTNASVVVGLNGQYEDLSQALWQHSPVRLAPMLFRQPGGHAEMMLCSNIRANPNIHDFPAQTIAYSGLPSLSFVGDRDRNGEGEGAQLGFTERDRQPAFLSPTSASLGDTLPLCIVAGATGSGKTMVLLNVADQFARAGTPVVIVDPKMDSDHSAVVEAAGGQVNSLDELAKADGVFDPLRFAASREAAVDLAVSMLMSINPWGPRKDEMEVPLQHAIFHGVSRGAQCIGQALKIAEAEIPGDLPPGMLDRVFNLAASSPMFRACVGMNPQGEGLRTANGITLIKVGKAHLELPKPGADPATVNIQQRIAAALVRMMVFGSAMALTGRGGVVMLDEAWVFLGAGPEEVQTLGRLARSQQVLPMLFTQRVTDALNAGLSGFISRGIILPIEDKAEAVAACELFKLEPTSERIGRITAKATKSSTNDKAQAPNWQSMRALRDPNTGQVLRGSVAIYSDMHGRAVPIEITLSKEFLELASTNPEDIRRRRERQMREADANG